MPVLASTLLVLAAQTAPVAAAAPADPATAPSTTAPSTTAPSTTAPSTTAPSTTTTKPATTSTFGPGGAGAASEAAARELRELQTLAFFEAELSIGRTLNGKDSAQIVALLADSPSPRVRATAAAVLAWLDPGLSTKPLLAATTDVDATVRSTAGQSLVPLARRLDPDQRHTVVAAALTLLDDVDDEVACVGAELLSVAGPEQITAAAEARAQKASDVRYACFARFAGLPVRAVTLPPMVDAPRDAPVDTGGVAAPDVVEEAPAETQWIFVANAAAAGLLVGGAIPTGLVPARDVLIYDDQTSRRSRQDISFATTVGSAVLGGAALGAGAYLLDATAGPLDSHEAIAVVGGTGSGVLLGAGLGFLLDPDGGGGALLLAGTTAASVVGSAALAYTTDLSSNDNALVASSMAMGALLGGLGVFTAMPVALPEINGVPRTDFGFGAVVAAGGAAGLVALGVSPFVEVTPARAAAVSAGGLLGAGLVGGIGFLATPGGLETSTRIAAGLGLGGQVIGMAVGALVPGAWLGEDADDVAVAATPDAAKHLKP